ncbi:MAG: DUF1993 domain-containing protein [Acetobacteraceae bacterium]
MITMYQACVPPCLQTLGVLSTLVDKAVAHCEAHKIDPAALLLARLYPNMYPFTRQIQVATDAAKLASARLAGVTPPPYPDTETTFPELTQRLAKTIAFLKTLEPAQFDGSETREIVIPTGKGERRMTGLAYLQTFALPNFYFHATTAYAILRHNGVELGKRDFLGLSG